MSSANFARSSKLMVGCHSMIHSLSEPDFWTSSYESYHESSNFAHRRYFTKFKWLYFHSAWCYSRVVEQASSPTCTVSVDLTLTRSKVKVKVTDHLNFRQLPINAHFQVYLLCYFCVDLKTNGWHWQYGTWSADCRRPIFEFPSRKGITRVQTSRNVNISRHSNGHIFRYWVMLQSHGWVHW